MSDIRISKHLNKKLTNLKLFGRWVVAKHFKRSIETLWTRNMLMHDYHTYDKITTLEAMVAVKAIIL